MIVQVIGIFWIKSKKEISYRGVYRLFGKREQVVNNMDA